MKVNIPVVRHHHKGYIYESAPPMPLTTLESGPRTPSVTSSLNNKNVGGTAGYESTLPK